MAWHLITLAFRTLTGSTDKLVLLALADQQREDTGAAWPSLDTLASMTSLTTRAVRASLRSLEAAGHITQVSPGGGRMKSASYRVHPLAVNPEQNSSYPVENPEPSSLFVPETRNAVPLIGEKPGTSFPVSDGNPERGSLNPERGSLNPERGSLNPERGSSEPLGTLINQEVLTGTLRSKIPLAWDPDLGWTGMTAEIQAELKTAYPRVNLALELRQADEWLTKNPKKRKSNYLRFLSTWLARSSPSRSSHAEPDDMLDSEKKERGAGSVFSTAAARPAPAGWRGAFEAVIGRAPDDGWGSLPPAVQADVRRALDAATELERAAWAEKEKGAA